jgi:hypothetical protein
MKILIIQLKERTVDFKHWEWHTAPMCKIRNAQKILVTKPEGIKLLGRHRWEDNIKMDH